MLTNGLNLFHESGLKMFAFTTKHHEGFSMFHTKTRVQFTHQLGGSGRTETGILRSRLQHRGDTVSNVTSWRDYASCAQARGLKIALYFSHPDWYDADFRPYCYHPAQVPSSPKLTDFEDAKKRLGDRHMIVRRSYARRSPTHDGAASRSVEGTADELWPDRHAFAGYVARAHVWPQMRDTILHLRKFQPDVMLRARGIGNYGDYYTPERFVPGGKENTTVPWMVIYPLASASRMIPIRRNIKAQAGSSATCSTR